MSDIRSTKDTPIQNRQIVECTYIFNRRGTGIVDISGMAITYELKFRGVILSTGDATVVDGPTGESNALIDFTVEGIKALMKKNEKSIPVNWQFFADRGLPTQIIGDALLEWVAPNVDDLLSTTEDIIQL